MKHNLLKSVILSVILFIGVSNAWGSVVGVAGSNPHNYTVKINVQRTYPNYGKDWFQQNMTQAPKGMTFEGKKLYIIGYGNTNMDGVEQMQFQYYDGNTWKEEVEAIGQWQTSDNYAHPYSYIYNYDEETWYENGNFVANFNFYFDATGWSQTSSLKMCIGHTNWHNYDALTNIPNTNLYYGTRSSGWGGAAGMCVVGNTTEGEGGNLTLLTISQNATEFTGFRNYILKSAGNTAYLMINKGNAGQRPDINYYDNFDQLNYTQTIKTVVKHGANDYTTENSKATISIKSYKITGNGVATEQNNSLTATSSTTTISAAHTATTTLTVSNIETGYKFDGWYDAATGGNRLSSDPTYTYYPTEAKTVYARFSEDNIFVVRGGEQFGDTWGSNVNVMTKKNEFEQIVYYTVSITGRNLEESNTAYQFKIYDEFTKKWYGLAADDGRFWYTRDMGEKNLVEGDGGKNIELRADVPGEYVIKVDYSDETKPKITITYPEKHTVTLHPVSNDWGYSDYGYFTVAYGEMTYTSSPSETIRFDVASGSTITIVESQHRYPDVYNCDIAWRVIGGEFKDWKNINNPVNYPITVNDDIEITDNFVVSKEAAESKNLHVFLRIKKDLMDEWISQDGNKKETGDAIRPGYKGDEFANFIYLCDHSTPGHTVQGSTPEERGCPKLDPSDTKEQPNGHFLMHDLKIDDDKYNYYYCTITDYGWFHIKFERKHADSDPGQGGWNEVRAGHFPGDGNNCYSIDNYSDGKFTGSWVEAPKCKVRAGYPDMGRYGIKYNNEIHYATSSPLHTVEFYVPFKSQIEILEGEHNNPAYTKTVALIESGVIKQRYEFSEQNKSYTHTVTGDVFFDDLFATKEQHDVYFRIANEGHPQPWYDQGYITYLYYTKPYGEAKLLDCVDPIPIDNYTYFKYKLPAGVAYFDFQRKTGKNGDTPHAQTINHYSVLFPNVNCFVLDGGQNGNNRYSGYWISMPSDGDFRLLYVEQIVTKKEEDGDQWITEVKRTYEHSSDLIKQSELNTKGEKIVSLHIFTKGKNPEVILQKYSDTQKKWEDIEAHMVNGPLETDDPGMGLLPGRKNATPGSDIDDFVYDDGIEKIKNDPTDDGCGVWNFTVYKNGESAKLNLISDDGLKRYTGKYYIRTDNAEGRWSDYTMPGNHMTYSSYAKKHSGFSHYFCKWLDLDIHFSSVSFIVANDYAHSLTDPSYLFDDQYIDDQWLPENANVRWGWDIVTNKVSRAYIQGTWTTNEPPARIHNLVLDYKPTAEKDDDKTVLLHDSGDWIYAINLTDTKVGSRLNSLTAKYPSTHTSSQVFAENIDMITGENDNKNTYTVRVQYDFKIDHTLIALLPNDKNANIGIDVVIERTNNNEDATQVQASVNSQKSVKQEDESTLTGSTVYGVFTFTKKFLTDNTLENQERFTHWFSFPFDVKLSDVFGFSPVGDYWMIRKYNGDKRAAEGLNETNTFWEYERDPNAILEANKGYILVLSTYLKQPNRDVYTNRDTLSLYFPATDLVTSINSDYFETPVEVPQHKNQNTTIKDWNWNMIGMPSYANKQETITQNHLYYFYDYSHKNNSYEVVWSGEKSFKSTFAYMVQFAGTINWKTFNFTKAQGLAPRERTDEEIQKHVLRLDLHRAGAREDKTYIQLIDENATTDFDMNLDLTKMLNSSKSNLYSLLNNHRLAANVLPIEETIIPLGVVTTTAGEYTFAMPNGTDGIIVELIDYETNTRTNMLLDNYTVNLGKGTFDNRFALHVKPDKTTTSVDNIGNEATDDKVKKYLIDGVLYMQKDGVLYDAQGRCVQ